MNVLMLVAVVGAMVLRQWSEAATVIFLFALAQMLETRSMERARRAIRGLMDLAPVEALVRRRRLGAARRVDAGGGRRDDRRAARRADSRSTAAWSPGRATSNQAPITGEALPAEQDGGRRGLRRHDQRDRRARCAGDASRARHDARPHHRPRRGRAGPARADADVRRAVRAPLHAGGHRAGGRRRGRAAPRARPAVHAVVLPCARPARHLLSVRARDLDAGLDRLGAGRSRATRRARQGRPAPRARRGA